MNENQQTINQWQLDTFKKKPSVEAAWGKMMDEIDEAADALEGEHAGHAEELADVYITLCGVAWASGVDLQAQVDRKMAINRARKWNVDENGIGQHIPDYRKESQQ